MANLTIYEFYSSPNAAGECIHPADVVTTRASTETHTLAQTTRAIQICADADCRMQINPNGVSTAASVSAVPILSAVFNQFTIAPAAGQTLKFA